MTDTDDLFARGTVRGPYYQFPFPLTDGQFAYLHLPGQLTRQDADRLKRMVDSLVMDDDPTSSKAETGEPGAARH